MRCGAVGLRPDPRPFFAHRFNTVGTYLSTYRAEGAGWARLRTALIVLALPLSAGAARGATFDTGTDLEIRWDNTVKLSAVYQPGSTLPNAAGYCAAPASGSTALVHSADGRSCRYGSDFISGRVDWLSELDLAYRDFGLHVSSAAWYDAVDNRSQSDRAYSVYNPVMGDTASLTTDSSDEGGRQIELSEAFVHGSFAVADDRRLSFRVGRHTLIWGESLYFSSNGIAAGQAPVDTYSVQALGNYEGRDAFLPVGQASFSLELTDDLVLQGYDQFEWRRSRIDPQDAYASSTDYLGAEGNRLTASWVPGIGNVYYSRGPDQSPGAAGQYGLAVKWHRGDFDFGLYGLRYNAKSPNIYFYPSNQISYSPPPAPIGTYRLEYPKGIEIYGLSATGPIGGATFGAEISARRNMLLVSGAVVVPADLTAEADNGGYPLYPVGDTLQALASFSYVTPPLPFLPGGANWTGEVAANHLLAATANGALREPGRTRTAAALRTIFEPRFFQLLPRVDVTVPIGFGYNFLGVSEVDSTMNRGTGDVSLGVTATLDQVWRASINLRHYFGRSKNAFDVPPALARGQALSDWDFVSMTVQRTF